MRGIEKSGSIRDTESAVAWFYRLLRNALLITDHCRRSGPEARLFPAEATEETAAYEAEIRGEVCACIGTLLPALKSEYADIIDRVDLGEQPLADAAGALAIGANNATVRLHRARAALKKQLERSCGTFATHGCLDCGCGRSQQSGLTHMPWRLGRQRKQTAASK